MGTQWSGFKCGDVVTLKCGGHPMVVLDDCGIDGLWQVRVAWMNDSKEPECESYPPGALQLWTDG